MTIWEQIVAAKAEWIGGQFGETDDHFGVAPSGVIKDIYLRNEPEGSDNLQMCVTGEPGGHDGFSFSLSHHGVVSPGPDEPAGALCITGGYGSTYWMQKRK